MYNTAISIGNAIVGFAHYIWSIKIEILRAIMTITGPLLILFAFPSPLSFTPLTESYKILELFIRGGLFIVGLGLIYFAWRIQINTFVIQTDRWIGTDLFCLADPDKHLCNPNCSCSLATHERHWECD
jgi:hypothetical protein